MLVQIALLDVVFSLDSVITAIGMVQQVPVMVAAVIAAVVVMMVFAGSVAAFVDQHPTIKILALSFLILIGTSLVAEGLHFHIPKVTSASRWRSRSASKCSTCACVRARRRRCSCAAG